MGIFKAVIFDKEIRKSKEEKRRERSIKEYERQVLKKGVTRWQSVATFSVFGNNILQNIKRNTTRSLCFICCMCGLAAHAQFSIDAELRNRMELRDGYRKLTAEGTTPSLMIWQRSRISFSYETDLLKLKFTPQDIRLWGDESIKSSTGLFGDSASMEMFEAYAELRLKELGYISVGRQPLVYDNQRILAARNWNNNGMTYDAVLLKLKLSNYNIHLGGTWNSNEEASSDNYYPSDRIKNLNFLWINREFGEKLNASLLHVASGITESDTSNTMNYRQTSGLYTKYKSDKLQFLGEAYYQYGKNTSGTTVSAFLIALDAAFKTKIITPGIGLSYLSGNSKTGTEQTTDNLFDIQYGARHRFYGGIDYFRSFSSHTKEGGLADFYYYLEAKLFKAVKIKNTGHFMQLAQTNAKTPDDKYLGYENDLVMKYKFNSWGTFEAGYLFYIPTESLETIQSVDDAAFSQLCYLQLTLKPTLFKQKEKEPEVQQ